MHVFPGAPVTSLFPIVVVEVCNNTETVSKPTTLPLPQKAASDAGVVPATTIHREDSVPALPHPQAPRAVVTSLSSRGATMASATGASAHISSDAIRASLSGTAHPFALPPGPEKAGEHCFSQLKAETFNVRGAKYLSDKHKAAAGPSVFDLMHVDMFLSNDKIGNVAHRRDSWLRKARKSGDTRYYLAIVYVTPAAPYVHLTFYYAVNAARVEEMPHFKKLWVRFTGHGPDADAFRNERWKVIPRIAEGSWIVQSAVGSKPALLAQKLTHTWILCDDLIDPKAPVGGAGTSTRTVEPTDAGCGVPTHTRGESYVTHTGPGPYLEADCDVASSSVAYVLVSLMQQYAKHIVIDLGFAIEPRAEDECPEVVLGSARLSRIDVSKPPVIPAEPGDWVLGALGVTHALDESSPIKDGEAAATTAH